MKKYDAIRAYCDDMGKILDEYGVDYLTLDDRLWLSTKGEELLDDNE